MFLSTIPMAARDPILGLNEQFSQDPRNDKVNLAVGVYYDDSGKIPLLDCVAEAEASLVASRLARGYQPIDGPTAFQDAVLPVVFGPMANLSDARRIATVQTVGGTSALRLAADFLRQWGGADRAMVSDPTWDNHRGVLGGAGLYVGTYRYLSAGAKTPDLDGMIADLSSAAPGTVVVLHACCHNPTGYDLPAEAWSAVMETIARRQLIPLLDIAYQGFGDGLEDDAAVVRTFLSSGLPFLVATSFSKNFSLYGERVGALSVVCPDTEAAARVRSQLKALIRTNYSNPPSHGGRLVTTVLSTPALREHWQAELESIRLRILRVRQQLATALQSYGIDKDFSFITRQKGMFSYSRLDAVQMQRLREDHGIYGVDTGRICVAALNSRNLEHVAKAMACAFQAQAAALSS